MKKALVALGAIAGLSTVVLVGGALYATSAARMVVEETYETHVVDFPVPTPLTEAELAELGPDEDPSEVAFARASA